MNWRDPDARSSLALGVVAVSFSSILFRVLERVHWAPPVGVAFWRLVFACAILVPLAWNEKSGPADPAAAPAPFFRGRTLPTALAAGALLALHFLTWFQSLRDTTVASSTLLVATQPLWSAALSPLLLKEKPSMRTLLGIGLALAGTAYLMGADFSRASLSWKSLRGDLLSFLSAGLVAAYYVLGRGLRARWPLLRYLLVVNASAALILALLSPLLGGSLAPPLGAIPWLFLFGLVPHVLGHGLLNRAVRRFPAYLVNLALIGEPLLATTWAWILFQGENPHASFFLAAGLIFAGLALGLREKRPAP